MNAARTIYNSSGKCLLENWVEERQVQDKGLDTIKTDQGGNVYSVSALPFKDGHPEILSQGLGAEEELTSTYRVSHKAPEKPGVRTVGRKKELLERALYAEVSNQLNDELNAPPPPTEFVSTTQKDFDVEGFKHELPAPEREHNVETEQPITFWSEHKQKIHGVSQVKTFDTPFKKNSSFSTPIEESFEPAKPYEGEPLPFM